MTTSSANTSRTYELGDENDIPVIAADIIYEGSAVGDNGSGYARPLVAADPFIGFALKKADNAAGAAGAQNVKVRAKGQIELPLSGASVADRGKNIYASDDMVFTLTSTSNSLIGKIKRFSRPGFVIVAFDATR